MDAAGLRSTKGRFPMLDSLFLRRALLTLLAVIVSAASPTPTAARPESTPSGVGIASAQLERAAIGPATPRVVAASPAGTGTATPRSDAYIPLPAGAVPGSPPASRPAVVAAPIEVPVPTAAPKPSYVGRNHVWMPSLGISRSVYSFPCSRGEDPDNLVYRWGCAGQNNVYLLGHAWGVFKALHDAYYNGKLRVGMVVYYADSNGRVRRYRVTTWRVVRPDQAAWAIADQPVPSMTLQTCLGANSEYRLNVRLVAG
jgi:hypothetical protein